MAKSSKGQRQFVKIVQSLVKAGLTHRQIARDINTLNSTVTRLKNGERRPSLEIACKIQELYGIPPRDWLTYK